VTKVIFFQQLKEMRYSLVLIVISDMFLIILNIFMQYLTLFKSGRKSRRFFVLVYPDWHSLLSHGNGWCRLLGIGRQLCEKAEE
jgi:hypothetical protein